MQFFSTKTQLYYLTTQLHVSANVSGHHRADSKNITERISAVAVLVGGLGPYKIIKLGVPVGMCQNSGECSLR